MSPRAVIVIMGKKFMASNQLDIFEDKHKNKRGAVLAQSRLLSAAKHLCWKERSQLTTKPWFLYLCTCVLR